MKKAVAFLLALVCLSAFFVSCSDNAAENAVSYKLDKTIEFGEWNWLVLDVQDCKALLITEDIVEARIFHDVYEDVTWETCTLRQYLNGEFYDKFNATDQARIVEANNINKNNQWFKTNGGNDTTDKVFLLSLEEVVKYFGDSGQLKKRFNWDTLGIDDEYDSARKAYFNGESFWWYLRSPGLRQDGAALVGYDGGIVGNGIVVNYTSCGVRPALWLEVTDDELILIS